MHDPRFEPLPEKPEEQVRRYARDLAYGAQNGCWRNVFSVFEDILGDTNEIGYRQNLGEYRQKTWDGHPPSFEQLVTSGYMTKDAELTEKSHRLLTSPASIFISYKRDESTALALLIIEHLKKYSISVFLDQHPDRNTVENRLGLFSGGEWERDIMKTIQKTECVLLLLAPKTLNSQPVRDEIHWALESDRKIISFGHRRFDIKQLTDDIPEEIVKVITSKTAITIPEENPDQYNLAIDRLIKDLGIVS